MRSHYLICYFVSFLRTLNLVLHLCQVQIYPVAHVVLVITLDFPLEVQKVHFTLFQSTSLTV